MNLLFIKMKTSQVYVPLGDVKFEYTKLIYTFTTFKKLEDRFNVYNHLAWNENVQYKSS